MSILRLNRFSGSGVNNGTTDNVVFCETFTGTTGQTTFQLIGVIDNATFSSGTWAVANVKNTYPSDVTDSTGKALFNSTNWFTKNRISVSSISSDGLVTLNYAPINAVSFKIYYWYSLSVTDILTGYYRDDIVSRLEETSSDFATEIANITQEPTGFVDADNVIVNYDSTEKKITLTGTWKAYWKGKEVTALTTGYVSDAHPSTLDKYYYLSYNGTAFVFDDNPLTLLAKGNIQIAIVWYGTNDKFALKEHHGIMPFPTHFDNHFGIGTVRLSGGALGSMTINSTTAGNRRPTVSECVILDEDFKSTILELVNDTYTQKYLVGSGSVRTYVLDQAEIIPLNGNRPYYNQWDGSDWQQQGFPNNAYGKIFVIAVPTTADSGSQKYRLQFMQPQTVSATLATIQGITTANMNFGDSASMLPEWNVIGEIIVRYTASNWVITSYGAITGSKMQQVTVGGNYLSAVSTDMTLSGQGTPASPLTINRWCDLTGTYASTSTFTFLGTDSKALEITGKLFTCTNSDASTRRIGYIKSAVNNAGTITATVVSDSNLADTDINFKYSQFHTIYSFINRITLVNELIKDTANPQGLWLSDTKFDSYLLPVDISVQTPATGVTASVIFNIYKNTTALFSTAIDLVTNATANEQRPTTNTITAGEVVSIRCLENLGTVKGANAQVKLFIVPTTIYLNAV